jgi:hypothetical protein
LHFLGRIGHLIGYNVPLPPGELGEESIQEDEENNVVAIGNHDPMQGIKAELNGDEII